MIHPTALIDATAQIGERVEVGPYAIIGAEVQIGDGCRIGPHAVISGPTRIGRDNVIHAHATVGNDPQDKKFAGERTELVVGDGNTIFEFTTISRGTGDGGALTRIGNHIEPAPAFSAGRGRDAHGASLPSSFQANVAVYSRSSAVTLRMYSTGHSSLSSSSHTIWNS